MNNFRMSLLLLGVAGMLFAETAPALNGEEKAAEKSTTAAVEKETPASEAATVKDAAAEKKSDAANEKNEGKETEKEDTLSITADSIEMAMDKHTVTLDGNVLVADSEMQLSAKKMVVFLDDENKVRNIEAMDDVSVRRLTTLESATGDKGFYDVAKDTVTLTGNCVLSKDKNTANGDRVVWDRKTGRFKLMSAVITIPMVKKTNSDMPFGLKIPEDMKKEKDEAKGEQEGK